MVQLAKGGLTAKQAMDAARGTLLLSAAAGIENAHAATIQADALNGFGLSAKSAGKVSDLLAASANASTSEITDMAQSLAQSSAVAHQANFKIADTVTALSNLANAGIKGSDAGTSLKTMLLRLMAPMGAGATKIKELGISLRDQSGELKKIPALAQEFTDKTKGMTKAQRDAAFAAIFGSDAIRAANILLGKGAGAHEKMKQKVTEQGAAAKLAAAKMKGFNGAIEAFKSAAETAAITFGQILLPMATDFVKKVTEWAAAFDKLTPAQQRATMQFAALAAAAGPALVILSKLSSVAGLMGGGFGKVAGPLGIAALALAALGASSESSRASLMQLGDALAPLAQMLGQVVSSPITLWMVAAGAAALGLVKGILAVRGAMAALTLAAASNPLGAFMVGAGVVLGAIIGITSAMGGGASAMDRFRDASNGAKAALDSLKNSSLGLQGAHLSHAAAVLEVKAANAGLKDVQRQVNDGTIKGTAASLALEQARLRVKQANLGVQTTSKGVSDAITKERADLVAHNIESGKAIQAAKDRIAQAKAGIITSGGSKAAVDRLKDAEAALARAMKDAGKVTADTSGKITTVGNNADTAAGKTNALKSRMDALKSKAVSIDVNTEQAMFNVLRLVGSMLQVASKTVTLTVKTNHVKGSWNDQETIEALRKEPTKRAFEVAFHATGTRALQAQLDQINARRSAQDRALAVSDAQRALADARKKGEGIAAAERALARARQDITIAGIEARLAIAQRGYDREKALIDRMNEKVKKGIEALKAAKSNAANLASGLSGMIGTGIDALTGQRTAALGNSPEAIRLREIEAQQKATSKAMERMRLDEAISEAGDFLERRRAQEDLDAWLLDQERQTLADSLTLQEQKIRDEADAKKTAAERGLADLQSMFSRGLIDHAAYIASAKTIVGSSVGDYGYLGSLLGESFRYGFEEQLAALFATVSNVAKLSNPAAPVLRLPNGPDPPPVRHRRAALGGIVGGAGLTDKVPLLAAPGEGVLSHRKMDSLWDMAMGGGGGGRGGSASFTVNVYDRTTTGMSRDAIRRLADQIAPELNRRVSMAA